MEEYIRLLLSNIEFYKNTLLSNLNLEIKNNILYVESVLSQYNALVIIVLFYLSFLLILYIISNLSKLFRLDTYIEVLFYFFKNTSYIRKHLLLERKKIYNMVIESFNIDKTNNVSTLPDNNFSNKKKTNNSLNSNRLQLKHHGQSITSILKNFEDISITDKMSFDKENKQTGCIYSNSRDSDTLGEIASELYSHVDYSNPRIYNSVKKIENNLLDIMLELFNANPSEGCGYVSTGGTESIMYALYGAKNYAISKGICPISVNSNSNYLKNGYFGCSYNKSNIPEVIAPVTIHAAVDKACSTYGLKLIKIEIDKKNYKMNIKKLKKSINSNTVCIVASAYNFPHGISDDIDIISSIAKKNKILFHVDACMGGFITCFYKYIIRNNYTYNFNSNSKKLEKLVNDKINFENFKPLDFTNEGVTSISCDIHKYGMTQKGASILMFKNKFYKNLMCNSLIGNDCMLINAGINECRPAALIASAFMIIIYNGRNVYIEQARRILSINNKIKKEIKDNNLYSSSRIQLIGDPIGSIFAIKGERIGVIHSELIKRGWKVNLVNNPVGIAFCITSANIENFENGKFFKDFKECYDYVYKNNIKQVSGLAAMYGITCSIPENIINMNMDVVMDVMIDTKEDTKKNVNKLDNLINKI